MGGGGGRRESSSIVQLMLIALTVESAPHPPPSPDISYSVGPIMLELLVLRTKYHWWDSSDLSVTTSLTN